MKLYRPLQWLLCLLLVAGIGACSSSKKKELEPVDLKSFKEEVDVDTLWSRKIGSGTGQYYNQFTLGLDETSVYAASENGKVFRLDKLTGKKVWKVSLDGSLTSGVAVDDQHAYVGSLDGTVMALDKETGKTVWIRTLNSEIVSAADTYAGHLVLQLANGEIVDLNSADGTQRWRYDSATPALTFRGNSRSRFFSSYVVTGLANGKLAVIDINTGQLLWEPKIAEPKGDTEIERIVDVDGTPLVLDGKLVAVSVQGQLAAYDLRTGRLLWSEDESSFRDVDAGHGLVFVSNMEGVVTAYDQESGSVKWSSEDLLRRKVSGPSVVGNDVVVSDFEGYVHLLNVNDGHLVARKRASWSAIRSPALVDGDRFYVIASNGRLKAYQLSGSAN